MKTREMLLQSSESKIVSRSKHGFTWTYTMWA